jgi:hypothetical protein
MAIHPKQLEEEELTRNTSTVTQTNRTISVAHSKFVRALPVAPNTTCVAMNTMRPTARIGEAEGMAGS